MQGVIPEVQHSEDPPGDAGDATRQRAAMQHPDDAGRGQAEIGTPDITDEVLVEGTVDIDPMESEPRE